MINFKMISHWYLDDHFNIYITREDCKFIATKYSVDLRDNSENFREEVKFNTLDLAEKWALNQGYKKVD